MKTITLALAIIAVVLLTSCVHEYPTYGSLYSCGSYTLRITPTNIGYDLLLDDVWTANSQLNIGDHITFEKDYPESSIKYGDVQCHTIGKNNVYKSITINMITYYLIK